MKRLNTDKAWIEFGKQDPYYGVLTNDQFLSENLTDSNKKKFFDTGNKYVEKLFEILNKEFQEGYQPKTALDFGCGTGRLTIPMARRVEQVLGVDISNEMLKETTMNAQKLGVNNVTVAQSEEFLNSLTEEQFDFIHSFIVFQHLNPKRGEKIFQQLFKSLKNGGVGVVHFTYALNKSFFERTVDLLLYRIPYLNNFVNLLLGKPIHRPLMQMNAYNLNRILSFLQKEGISEMQMKFTNHGGIYGVMLLFQKQKKTPHF